MVVELHRTMKGDTLEEEDGYRRVEWFDVEQILMALERDLVSPHTDIIDDNSFHPPLFQDRIRLCQEWMLLYASSSRIDRSDNKGDRLKWSDRMRRITHEYSSRIDLHPSPKDDDEDIIQRVFGERPLQPLATAERENASPTPPIDVEDNVEYSRSMSKQEKMGEVPKRDVPAELAAIQKEQMEAAVAEMAQQMKDRTRHIHEQLQQQNQQLLQNLETSLLDNTDALTKVTEQTQAHVRKQWYRTFSTWTMLLIMVAAFAATLLLILVIPKPSRRDAHGWKNPVRDHHPDVVKADSNVRKQENLPVVIAASRVENETIAPESLGYSLHQMDSADSIPKREEEERNDPEAIVTTMSVPLDTIPHLLDKEPEPLRIVEEVERTTVPMDTKHQLPEEEPEPLPVIDEVETMTVPVYTKQHLLEEEPEPLPILEEFETTTVPVDTKLHLLEEELVPLPINEEVETMTVPVDTKQHLLEEEPEPLPSNEGFETTTFAVDTEQRLLDEEPEPLPRSEEVETTTVPVDTEQHLIEEEPEPLPLIEEVETMAENYENSPHNEEWAFREAAAAASSGDFAQLQLQLASWPRLVQVQDTNGWTLLHEAARNGHAPVIEYLLAVVGDPVTLLFLTTNQGQTALDIARDKWMDASHPAILILERAMAASAIKEESNDAYTVVADLRADVDNKDAKNLDAPSIPLESVVEPMVDDASRLVATPLENPDEEKDKNKEESSDEFSSNVGNDVIPDLRTDVDNDDMAVPNEPHFTLDVFVEPTFNVAKEAATVLTEPDEVKGLTDEFAKREDEAEEEEEKKEDDEDDDNDEEEHIIDELPWDYATDLIVTGDVEELRKLLALHPNLVSQMDAMTGDSLLHVAAQHDHTADCVELLLEYGSDVWYRSGASDHTALDVAIATHPDNNHHPIIVLLQEAMGFGNTFGSSFGDDTPPMEEVVPQMECDLDVSTGECRREATLDAPLHGEMSEGP